MEDGIALLVGWSGCNVDVAGRGLLEKGRMLGMGGKKVMIGSGLVVIDLLVEGSGPWVVAGSPAKAQNISATGAAHHAMFLPSG